MVFKCPRRSQPNDVVFARNAGPCDVEVSVHADIIPIPDRSRLLDFVPQKRHHALHAILPNTGKPRLPRQELTTPYAPGKAVARRISPDSPSEALGGLQRLQRRLAGLHRRRHLQAARRTCLSGSSAFQNIAQKVRPSVQCLKRHDGTMRRCGASRQTGKAWTPRRGSGPRRSTGRVPRGRRGRVPPRHPPSRLRPSRARPSPR